MVFASSVVCCAWGPSTVHAQTAKPAVQDSATAEARARFEEGIDEAERGDHESARLKFNQAWALSKSPMILYNLARAEQLSGHLVDALEHYRLFVKMSSDPKVTDVQRQRTAENIAEISKKVGQIEVEAPAGTKITVDGRPIAADSTDPIPVAAGKHVVEAVSQGSTKRVTLDVAAGAIVKAKLFEKTGELREISANSADSDAPTESREREEKRDEAQAGPSQPGDFWTSGRITGAGLVIGSVVALGAGIALHLSVGSSDRKAEEIRNTLPEPRSSACTNAANASTCEQLRLEVDSRTTRENVRNGLFIGSATLLVGGAALFLLSSPKSDSTRGKTRVVPVVTGRESGLAFFGTF